MDYSDPPRAQWIGVAQIITIAISFRRTIKSDGSVLTVHNNQPEESAMKTVTGGFARKPTAADGRGRTRTYAVDIRRMVLSGAADVDLSTREELTDSDLTFIYARAARTRPPMPTLITVETANGLALQMMKA
jgi:hypothetical protein